MKYRPDIDGLRAVAVLPVVLYHAGIGASGGFVGVDVFFVISGFLITRLIITEIEESRFSILDFYERRARRLFPALFAMLAFTIVCAAIIMVPFDLEVFGNSVIATTLFASNLWFFTQEGYFNEAAELQPLLHTWSLGVEEQYYLLFPLLLLWLCRIFSFGRVFGVVAGLALISFCASIYMLRHQPEAAFYLPHLRAWELLIGSLAGLAAARGQPASLKSQSPLKGPLSLVGLALILGPVFFYSTETAFPGLAALPPCAGAALLIITGIGPSTLANRFLSLSPMVFVGKLSYSLYLWHWPVISFAFYMNGKLSPMHGIACLGVSVVLAYVSWRFVEQPVRNRNAISVRAIFMSSLSLMGIAFAIGIFFLLSKGLPHRMDPNLLALSKSEAFLHDRRDCHFVTSDRARIGDVCVRGKDGVTPSFALIGDSHGDAFSPAVFAAAQDLGMAGYQYTNAGLIPFADIRRLGQTKPDAADALTAFLEVRPELDTLIVSLFWQYQFSGHTYRHTGHVLVDDDYDGTGAAYNAKATRNGLIMLAKRFPDRQFILLDDVPAGDALHVRSQLRLMKFEPETVLGLPYETYQTQRQTYEPHLIKLASTVSNLHYRPVFNTLCTQELCPLFSGETLLYRDGDHLSWNGALRLKPQMKEILSELPLPSQ